MHTNDTAQFEPDMNLVEMWTRKDPTRWVAGILAGLFAGLVSLVAAGLVSSAAGYEFWFAPKLAATIVLGGKATYTGMNPVSIGVGVVLYEVVAAFLGFAYAHF